jgi:hypothetical protein
MQLGMPATIYIVVSRSGVVPKCYSSGAGWCGVQGAGKRGAQECVELVMPLDNRVGVTRLMAEAGDKTHDQRGWSLSSPAGKGV